MKLKCIPLLLLLPVLMLVLAGCGGDATAPLSTYTPTATPTPEVVAKEMVGTIALMFVIVVAWFVAWVLV